MSNVVPLQPPVPGLDEDAWDDLLNFIEERRVIPIVGPELLKVDTPAGPRLLYDWMDGDRSYRVTEEVVGLGHYGRTLTVLTCSSLSQRPEADEDEDEEEAALIESWTPRFRK